jgi:uncharacterized damage-inducible protein DinB
MLKQHLLQRLQNSEKYFDRSTSCLAEEHSGFRPREEVMTAAQHVAHVAQTVDWFLAGAFGDGFDLDFEGQAAEVAKVTSMTAAREWLRAAFARARDAVEARSEASWSEPFPEGPLFAGAPRCEIVHGIEDHTAHHRGALTVYSRLSGLTPPMPYM